MDRLQTLRTKVIDLYEKKNPERADWADWLYENHVFDVADTAHALALRFGAKEELSAAGGMLHDIADAVMSRFDPAHEEKSAEVATDLLRSSGFSEEEIEIVVNDAMKYHSCRDGQLPKTLEGQIVATADAVAHLTTNYYPETMKMVAAEKGEDAAKKWAAPKIERDFHVKIFFDEVKVGVDNSYEKVRKLAE